MNFFVCLSTLIILFLLVNTTLGYKKMLSSKAEKYHYEHDEKVYDYDQIDHKSIIMGHTIDHSDNNEVAKKGLIFDLILLAIVLIGILVGTLKKDNSMGYLGVLSIAFLVIENICEYLHMTGKGMRSQPIISFIIWAIILEAVTLLILLILLFG